MPVRDYSKATIYKLCSDFDPYYYIGSTTNGLARRLAVHKSYSVLKPQRKVYHHFNTIGFENVKIVLVERVSVRDKEELLREEDRHIKERLSDKYCLNLIRAKRSIAEYRVDNRERLKEKYRRHYEANREKSQQYAKTYYESHKEVIVNKRKEKLHCHLCNTDVVRNHFKRHEKGRPHQLNLQEVKTI